MPADTAKSIEDLTQRIGREIFERAEAAAPSVFALEFWQKAAMDWLTRDDDLKFRVFRFIEVFPNLRTDQAIAAHLHEYLGPATRNGRAVPAPLKLALAFQHPDSPLARVVARASRIGCSRMARQFVCGTTPTEAVASIERLRRRGMTFTLDVLGETVIAERVAAAHQQTYLDLIEEFSVAAPTWTAAPILDTAPWGPLPRVNISIKLSALVSKFDPVDIENTRRVVASALRRILRFARDRGAFINVDTEHYAVKDLTLEVARQVLDEPEFRAWPDCGLVIQAYLTDARRDLLDLIAWARRRGTPVTVRLVKGAYWDHETIRSILSGLPTPVFTQKCRSDVEFEDIARIMLDHSDVVRPAFASHNVRSIAAVLAMEQVLDLPPRTLELQMLTGMGDPLKRAAVQMGRRLRVYAPVGNLIRGMAYLIRRLIENTSNESFLRQSFTDHTPTAYLLRNPADLVGEHSPPPYEPVIIDPDIDECPDMTPFHNEPDVDLAQPENRDAMTAALRFVQGDFGRTYPAVIAGEPVNTEHGYESTNPADTTQIVGRTALCDDGLVDRAVAAARAACEDWQAVPPEERAERLSCAADALHDERFVAAAWQVWEAGKTCPEALSDVIETIDYLRFYARDMVRLVGKTRRRDYPGEANEYVYQPRGVVAVISPFCYPTALPAGMIAAALVTGNTVVFKPARAASVCAAHLVARLIESGLPPGVLNFCPGSGDTVGEALARHPDVDMIAFTGSSAAGRRIIRHAREPRPGDQSFKHVIADMGAKNAIIVDTDADLDEAVQAVIASAFGYSGQKCTACSRVIVLDGVYDDFLDKLVDATRGIEPAAPDNLATTVGPLIHGEAVDRVRRYIDIGKTEARCALDSRPIGAGGSSSDRLRSGHFVSPVIFADVPPDARIAQEEILGPVLAVIRADNFDGALGIANGTAYALVAGVFSRSPRNIERAKHRLRAGVLYINRRVTASRVDRQPFGGFAQSGLGTKTGGPDYLREFVVARTISENTLRHGFAPVATPEATEPQSQT